MTNYRIYKIVNSLSATTQSVYFGENPSGSAQTQYKSVWGVMTASGSVGYVSMSGGGALNLAHISPGQPLPCFPSFVSCSSGTVYILA